MGPAELKTARLVTGPNHNDCKGVEMADTQRTRVPVDAPRKCAIEGCNTPTTQRRCPAHQAQLERNLAVLAGRAA